MSIRLIAMDGPLIKRMLEKAMIGDLMRKTLLTLYSAWHAWDKIMQEMKVH